MRMVVAVRRKLQEECRLLFVIKLRTFPISPSSPHIGFLPPSFILHPPIFDEFEHVFDFQTCTRSKHSSSDGEAYDKGRNLAIVGSIWRRIELVIQTEMQK